MLLLGLKFISNNFMMRTLDLIKRIKYYQSKDNKLLDIPDSVCIAYEWKVNILRKLFIG